MSPDSQRVHGSQGIKNPCSITEVSSSSDLLSRRVSGWEGVGRRVCKKGIHSLTNAIMRRRALRYGRRWSHGSFLTWPMLTWNSLYSACLENGFISQDVKRAALTLNIYMYTDAERYIDIDK